ncbi:MAG: hypothetical protein ACR2F6_15790 [Mycobacteriales bacterium]
MTLRAGDLRFVSSRLVRTAVVDVGSDPRLTEVAQGLRESGVVVTDTATSPVDLLIATAAGPHRTPRPLARTCVLLGRGGLRDRRMTGRAALPLTVRGDVTRPTALVPLRPPDALRHYLSVVAAPRASRERARNRAVTAALRLRLPVQRISPATTLTVVGEHSAEQGAPAMVAAAAHLGVPVDVCWMLALGSGDDLQRAVFHLLDRGSPRWVLKFCRVPGVDAPFVRDQKGLQLAHAAGPAVTAHSPTHLGRFELGGSAASLETAAPGRPLLELLNGRPLSLVDDIADWVIRMGTATADSSAALGPERDRLIRFVLPRWTRAGGPGDIVERLPPLPAVLQHNDLGSWNIISDGHSFAAVDWESARAAGLPLWDLLYLLADVLARMDGPAAPEILLERAIALFAGRSRHSQRLFRWVRAAVAALALPHQSVGPLAALCWMHHGLSPLGRSVALAGAPAAPTGHLARMGDAWLAHPELGVRWSAWSA